MNTLYTKNSLMGSLHTYFSSFFQDQTCPTQHLLIQLLQAMLAVGPSLSIHFLFEHFLKEAFPSSLNSYYYACANPRLTEKVLLQRLVRLALKVSQNLPNEPVFLSCDDTTIEKAGPHLPGVNKLYDHSKHQGSHYVNGHCWVSLTLCVPVIQKQPGTSKIHYLPISLGYKLWEPKKRSKLELAADLVEEAMQVKALKQRQIILSADSWYMKAPFIQRVKAYPEIQIIGNVRHDSRMYELPSIPEHIWGRLKKYGEKIDIHAKNLDFSYQMNGYRVCHKLVIAKLFGDQPIHAYITESKSGNRRLFFSTLNPAEWHMSAAWQDDPFLRQAGSNDQEFYPLRLYALRWKIETNYYEQKTFWDLGKYMLRSQTGITHLVNLLNLLHSSMKLLPYLLPELSKKQGQSAQEIRFFLGQQIRREVLLSKLRSEANMKKSPKPIQEALDWLFSRVLKAA